MKLVAIILKGLQAIQEGWPMPSEKRVVDATKGTSPNYVGGDASVIRNRKIVCLCSHSNNTNNILWHSTWNTKYEASGKAGTLITHVPATQLL